MSRAFQAGDVRVLATGTRTEEAGAVRVEETESAADTFDPATLPFPQPSLPDLRRSTVVAY